MNSSMIPICGAGSPITPKIPSRFTIQHEDLQFERQIGSGACGEVWLGTYIPQQFPVAIKKLYSTEIKADEMVTWTREIEIHATLRHQFLLSFVGYTVTYPFTIVTAYVPNGSLYDILHSDKFSLNGTEKTKIAYSIACGMKYLHDQHIMHRDLKSPNILLDDEKLPKICDFGLSRTREYQTLFTRTVGTPQWMAPELVKSEKYTEKVDVYAYGVVLWEMLTNEAPFEGMDTFQIVYQLSSNPNPHPIPPDSPKALGDLITKCVSPKSENRPSFLEILNFFETLNVRFENCEEATIVDFFNKHNSAHHSIKSSNSTNSTKTSNQDDLHARMKAARRAATPQSFKMRAPIPLPRNLCSTLVPSQLNATTTTNPQQSSLSPTDSFNNSANCNNNDNDISTSEMATSMTAATSSSSATTSTSSSTTTMMMMTATMLEKLNSHIASDIQIGIEYFEALSQDTAAVAIQNCPFWERLLSLVLSSSCPSDLETRSQHLMIQYAKNRDVLSSIKSVKSLSSFVHGKTLDLFLYAVNVFPEICDDDFLAQLQLMVIRQEPTNRLHSTVLMCKICAKTPKSNVRDNVVDFFLSIAPKFTDRIGGNLVFGQLFSVFINNLNGTKNGSKVTLKTISELIHQYIVSEIDENVIVAYHSIFLLLKSQNNDINKNNNQINNSKSNNTNNKINNNDKCINLYIEKNNDLRIDLDIVLAHLLKSEKLSEVGLDYLARVNPTEFPSKVIDSLLDCFEKYNNQKAILLLCRIAAATPEIVCANERWTMMKGAQAVAFFPILLIVGRTNPNFIISQKSSPKFLCEILNFGDRDSFPALCWLFLKCEITPELAERFDECTIFHLICQRLKNNTKSVEGIIMGAKVISRLAEVRFSTSYGVMVQHLSRCAAEKREVAAECIRALAVLIKYPDLKKVFNLCQVASVVERFRGVEELRTSVEHILFELSK